MLKTLFNLMQNKRYSLIRSQMFAFSFVSLLLYEVCRTYNCRIYCSKMRNVEKDSWWTRLIGITSGCDCHIFVQPTLLNICTSIALLHSFIHQKLTNWQCEMVRWWMSGEEKREDSNTSLSRNGPIMTNSIGLIWVK